MNKKYLFLLSLLMMLSFTTGIFVEVAAYDPASVILNTESFWNSLSGTAKQDLLTVFAAIFFAATVYLTPCLVLFLLFQTFSLGFSAAYLLAGETNGLLMLLALLLPRSLLKLPAYIALIMLSFHTAKQIKSCRSHHHSWKKFLFPAAKSYALCAALLLLSSVIEVVLLQAVL